MPHNTRAELDRLLQIRNERPEQTAAIDAQIKAVFCQNHAILVLDMSGFSRLTLRYSIIHFLAMVRQMGAIVCPIVEQQGGSVVKREADNVFAVFSTVDRAVEASIEILKKLEAANQALPDSQDLYASIGIGYGEVLMVGENDMYGNEMNLACKLGEDLARSSEILLTRAAFAQVARSSKNWEKLEFSIAGIDLITYKLQRSSPASPNL